MTQYSNDFQHKYYILAPLTPEANERLYQYDIYNEGEIADCFSGMVLDENDLPVLEHRLFDLLNAKFDIMINAYEEEILENSKLSDAIALIDAVVEIDDNSDFTKLALKLKELLTIALQSKTDVGFYF